MILGLWTYLDKDGTAPFEAWVGGLDKQAQARVTIALARLANGNTSNVEAKASRS